MAADSSPQGEPFAIYLYGLRQMDFCLYKNKSRPQDFKNSSSFKLIAHS